MHPQFRDRKVHRSPAVSGRQRFWPRIAARGEIGLRSTGSVYDLTTARQVSHLPSRARPPRSGGSLPLAARGEPPTVAAPLARCSELPMFDGHPLALAELAGSRSSRTDAVALPGGRRGFKGHRLPVLRVAPKLGTHGRLCVRARLKPPWGWRTDLLYHFADPELRRGGALWIAGLLTPLARATARVLTIRGGADALANRREGATGVQLVGGSCQHPLPCFLPPGTGVGHRPGLAVIPRGCLRVSRAYCRANGPETYPLR